MPFNVNYLFEDDFNGSGEYFGRPDPRRRSVRGHDGPDKFLNLSAFAAPCTPNGEGGCAGGQHFGNLSRNAFTAPGYHNVDLSLVKNTRLGDRRALQVRLDTFNVFNHANFANPLLPNFADRLPAERHRSGDEPRRRLSAAHGDARRRRRQSVPGRRRAEKPAALRASDVLKGRMVARWFRQLRPEEGLLVFAFIASAILTIYANVDLYHHDINSRRIRAGCSGSDSWWEWQRLSRCSNGSGGGGGSPTLHATAEFLRTFLPFIMCIAVYTNLHDTVRYVNSHDIHPYLAAAEEWLFGGQPVLWAEAYITPRAHRVLQRLLRKLLSRGALGRADSLVRRTSRRGADRTVGGHRLLLHGIDAVRDIPGGTSAAVTSPRWDCSR